MTSRRATADSDDGPERRWERADEMGLARLASSSFPPRSLLTPWEFSGLPSTATNRSENKQEKAMSVVIETTLGDLTIDLLVSERPKTCFNFIKLCKIKYYNSCPFSKIEKDFLAQSGDPDEDGGTSVFRMIQGEECRFFERERKPRLKHEKLGTISMVNNGQDLNGSQFFITLGENLDFLDPVHTVFGEVVEGSHVLLDFNSEICDIQHRPFRDIFITHTVVLHDPYPDPPNLHIPDRSPEIPPRVFCSTRIGVGESIEETEGKPLEVVEEELEEKEAKARATILEMIGDLPEADVKPPENVLFVCKLNPVTRDEDLEVIFSRFGRILNCEIIRAANSGESLQYAFIEFEKMEDCEKAYFKMDNVLIDDRRIHVDFSQSVSKYKWKGKGKGVQVFRKEDSPSSGTVGKRPNRAPYSQRHSSSHDSHRRRSNNHEKRKGSSDRPSEWRRSPEPRHSNRWRSPSPGHHKKSRYGK